MPSSKIIWELVVPVRRRMTRLPLISKVGEKRVILSRTGTTNSQMVFEEGTQHTSLYETRFGELAMDIQTAYLRHNLTPRGGLMEIRYSIAVEHALTGRNMFKIRVKPKMQ